MCGRVGVWVCVGGWAGGSAAGDLRGAESERRDRDVRYRDKHSVAFAPFGHLWFEAVPFAATASSLSQRSPRSQAAPLDCQAAPQAPPALACAPQATGHKAPHMARAACPASRIAAMKRSSSSPYPIPITLQPPCNVPITLQPPCNHPATTLQRAYNTVQTPWNDPARDDGACAPGARSNNNLCGGRLHREGAFQLGSPLALGALALALTADQRRLLRDARDAPKAATRSFGLSVSALGAPIPLVTLCRARLVQQRDLAAQDA